MGVRPMNKIKLQFVLKSQVVLYSSDKHLFGRKSLMEDMRWSEVIKVT